MRIRAQAEPWASGISFALFGDNRQPLKPTLVTEPLPQGCYAEPFLSVSMEQAQVLLDDLWHAGLRPSSGEGSVGELRATRDHLADVRKLLAAKVKVAL